MSDLFIPGVSDTYKTDQIIQELMKAERTPVVRMENEVQTYRSQKSAWQSLSRNFSSLRENARTLFGFQNPFQNRIARSSDPAQLTATAQRAAAETEAKIRVRQLAGADRFMSRSLDRGFQAQAGTYRFRVGEREVSLRFPGGSLRDLAELINRRAEGLLKASVVNDTPGTQVIVVESLKTGSRNPLTFHDEALAFGERAGLLIRTETGSRDIGLDPLAVRPWEKPLQKEQFSVRENTLSLKPGGELTIPLEPPLSISGPLVLAMDLRTELLPAETPDTAPPPGPVIPTVGGVEYEGVRVQSDASKVVLPPWQPPQPPDRVDDMQVLFLEKGGAVQPLPAIADSGDFQTLRFPELGDGITALKVRNANTHRVVHLANIRVLDTMARGDFRPVRPLATARDSIVEMDGVEVTRDSNTLSDLIPSVSLTLLAESDRPATLSVGRDLESIKNSLIELVGSYNRLVTEIDVLTRRDDAVIEDAMFFSEEEKKKARSELGLFMGDLSLMQVKSNLQRIMMNPYPTDGDQELSLLAQIGISTHAAGAGGALNKTRLRGYLEIDEERLDQGLAAHPEWVRQMFGHDQDGDLVADAGVAFTLERYLRPYVDTGGAIPTRISNLDGMIARKNKDIEEYNRKLEKIEVELKQKYGKMAGALDAMKQNSQALDNWNSSNRQQ
jgi:flagellar hook-associated protein 2